MLVSTCMDTAVLLALCFFVCLTAAGGLALVVRGVLVCFKSLCSKVVWLAILTAATLIEGLADAARRVAGQRATLVVPKATAIRTK